MFRIVHLSDFHFSFGDLKDFKIFIINKLIEDLKKANIEKEIDCIAITGDLIDKGGKSFGSMDQALASFDDIVIRNFEEELKIDRSRIFFAIGNHDVEHDKDSEIVEAGLAQTLNSIEAVNRFIDKGSEGVKRIESFKKYEKDFYNENHFEKVDITNFNSSFLFHKESLSIGVCCLNSSWRCCGENEKLILGERQITNCREIIENAELKIALMHHPINSLVEFDKKNVQGFLIRDFDILLLGHTHESSSFSMTTMQSKLLTINSPSNWSYNIRSESNVYLNGYQIIDYNAKEDRIDIHHRKYSHKKEKYVANTDCGDDSGKEEHKIPAKKEMEQWIVEQKITKNIQDIRLDEINEHLVTYFTNSNAPKTIKEIFVEPRLAYWEMNEEEEEQEKYVAIEELCASRKNYLIFGSKEIGKTILLDKLLMKFADEINKYHLIPIYLDFSELKHTRFETKISQFCNISIRDMPDFLVRNKIVLLIDNFNFIEENVVNFRRLEAFYKENSSSIRIIATSFSYMQGQAPINFLDLKPQIDFFILHIKSFSATQIKKLISNWFRYNKDFDTPDKYESVLNILLALNLPRTPLAISMFLWIIEQQEGFKPQNQAMMLENFIELLLEKTSKKTVLSEKFDYTNKVRLLSEIAYEMLTSDKSGYCLPYNELSNFVHNRILKKKFDYKSVDIINDLLTKGIFVQEHNGTETIIKFRFNCFFEYFLMKKMEFDEKFLADVMTGQNFLKFHNEIDYLTGIKRDRSDILKHVLKTMNYLFSELNEKIDGLKEKHDTIFKKKSDSIASQLEDNFVIELNEKRHVQTKEMEEVEDKILDELPSGKGVQRKKEKLNRMQKLERSWIIAAKLLKNNEEIDDGELKSLAIKEIVKCSLSYSFLYKYYLQRETKKTQDKNETSFYEEFLIDFLPFIHQIILRKFVGTAKLNVVIREYLEEVISNDNVTDLEKFVVVFLYSDLEGRNSHKYISKFVKQIKKNYIYDAVLFKLISLYYFRSSTPESDKYYENILGDLLIKAKGIHKMNKGTIIQDYKKKKQHDKDKFDNTEFM